MIGVGLDAGHTFVIGQFFTGVVDLLRQVGHAEQIDILKAVGFPELGFFGQHVFGTVCIKIHLGGQRQLVLTTELHIESALIDLAQALHGIFPCHSAPPSFPCMRQTRRRSSFAVLIAKETKEKSYIFS